MLYKLGSFTKKSFCIGGAVAPAVVVFLARLVAATDSTVLVCDLSAEKSVFSCVAMHSMFKETVVDVDGVLYCDEMIETVGRNVVIYYTGLTSVLDIEADYVYCIYDGSAVSAVVCRGLLAKFADKCKLCVRDCARDIPWVAAAKNIVYPLSINDDFAFMNFVNHGRYEYPLLSGGMLRVLNYMCTDIFGDMDFYALCKEAQVRESGLIGGY